jgi:hypothetical protein
MSYDERPVNFVTALVVLMGIVSGAVLTLAYVWVTR